MRILKQWKVALPILLMAAIVGFYPFSTTDVPPWRLRVVNENGIPYSGKEVTQVWKNYTLESEAGQHFDERATNASGLVEFPERTTSASLLKRVSLSFYSTAKTLAHGGVGVHAYVHASGPQGYASVNYTPKETPPDKLVLPTQ